MLLAHFNKDASMVTRTIVEKLTKKKKNAVPRIVTAFAPSLKLWDECVFHPVYAAWKHCSRKDPLCRKASSAPSEAK
jgi:hypothetical protein